MNIIVCVDDELGMMFNNRRQSQDRELRARVLHISSDSKLWMNHYSEKQFANENAENINVDDSFLNEAVNGEYAFVENEDISKYESWIEKLIVYKWNRRYPSDLQMTVDLSKWKLESSYEFVGSSHEKITEEVYVK